MDKIKEILDKTISASSFDSRGTRIWGKEDAAKAIRALIDERVREERERIYDWLYSEFDCSQFGRSKNTAFKVVEKILEALQKEGEDGLASK